jgi:hypothetical protein
MYKVFLGTTLIASGLCYYLYQENQKLLGNVKSLEVAVEVQEKTIESLQSDFALQGQSLLDLQRLIETRVNNATKEVFDGIEQDSRDIDDADDGLILQPTPKADIRG